VADECISIEALVQGEEAFRGMRSLEAGGGGEGDKGLRVCDAEEGGGLEW
jgi:hypothetical protein